MAKTYALGAVKPWVRTAADIVGNRFDVDTIYGVGARAGASEHPKGLALDFMVGKDRAKGDAIYAFGKANWDALGISYIIWYQQIDEGSGLKPMANRGGDTANHKDHNHWSFKPTAPNGAVTQNISIIPGVPSDAGSMVDAAAAAAQIGSVVDAIKFVSEPANWWRVFLFIVGGALLIVVLWRWVSAPAKSLRKAIA